MSSLTQLLNAERKPALVKELSAFVDTLVAEQSGLAGLAIKGALGTAKKLDAAIVAKGLNRVLPDIVPAFDQYWGDFLASGQADFGEFVRPQASALTDAILATTDAHVDALPGGALVKAYASLRGKGAKLIAPHVPAFACVLQQHMQA